MSKSVRKQKFSSRTPLINEQSDLSLSCIPYADEESANEDTTTSFDGSIDLYRNVDLSILVHLSDRDRDREQSDSRLERKPSGAPVLLPGFLIKVHNVGRALRRNSISLPTGLSDCDLEALRFRCHIPDGGEEYQNINKQCEEKVSDKLYLLPRN